MDYHWGDIFWSTRFEYTLGEKHLKIKDVHLERGEQKGEGSNKVIRRNTKKPQTWSRRRENTGTKITKHQHK